MEMYFQEPLLLSICSQECNVRGGLKFSIIFVTVKKRRRRRHSNDVHLPSIKTIKVQYARRAQISYCFRNGNCSGDGGADITMIHIWNKQSLIKAKLKLDTATSNI